jgi:predicted phage baseplate assembly protein
MANQYFCQNEQRKNKVRLDSTMYNGIDYLEVADEAQQTLHVRFLKADNLGDLTAGNVRIEGGQRIRNIQIKNVHVLGVLGTDALTLVVEADKAGDFSLYTLRIVQGVGDDAPLEWMDQVLSSVEFSFKAACPSEFDCRQVAMCPPETLTEPEIDYLAKDFGSFRHLMLDRLSVIMPQWKERNPSDIGVAAVEALAYAADHLSYYQDAVATEAYLGTARRRVSVRRHARLLDYVMHDGCNARAWVVMNVESGADGYVLRARTPLLTGGDLPSDLQVQVCEPASATTTAQASAGKAASELSLSLNDFTLCALDSLCIEEDTEVHSGHFGANRAATTAETAAASANTGNSEGGGRGSGGGTGGGGGTDDGDTLFPCETGWSVVLEQSVQIHQDSAIYGDRVKIKDKAKVYDVFYNTMENEGTIHGTEHTPLSLPLLEDLPSMPAVDPGTEDVTVQENETETLAPGRYGRLVLENHAKLILSGGRYDFQSWQIGDYGFIVAVGSCEIVVAGRLTTGESVQIRPEEGSSSVVERDILIYAGGEAGADPEYSPLAVDIGKNNHVNALVYAPDGLVIIGEHAEATATFFGRWIRVDKEAQLHLPSQKQEPSEGSEDQRIFLTNVSGDLQVFETLHDITLRGEHNQIAFYTWGDEKCCLPKGATRASLTSEDNALQNLREGDVLLFEEVLGLNGTSEDADVSRRHVVRLTAVETVTDPLYDEQVVNIEWAPEDALPFPLCLQVVDIEDDQGAVVDRQPMSVARANVVLADHGRTICDEPLVPETVPSDAPYRPRFQRTDITFRVPYYDDEARTQPANGLLLQDPRAALPDADLRGNTELWAVQRDLLESDRFALEYVVETESDGRAYVRFGDNVLGKRPAAGTAFRTTYRVGNGIAGNVGAETISRVMLPGGESTIQDAITARNPLPAQGGTEPESIEQVKLYAPQAFRTQERAVTPGDYADMAQRHAEVQRAVATQRWTGSWHTVFITIDRRGGRSVDEEFEKELRDFLEPFRTMGHDLEIEAPRLVALDIALQVCVGPEYRRIEVNASLLDEFSSGVLPDGRLGFFHPDNFTFGQHVYLSRVIAAAMQVPGVVWVQADRFERWGRLPQGELAAGVITMGALEIARLDNDPNAPENGRIEFLMQGGL